MSLRYDIETIRAYQALRHGRRAAWFFAGAFLLVVLGLALPDLVGLAPEAFAARQPQFYTWLTAALPYVSRAMFGWAAFRTLRAGWEMVKARSWWWTERLNRRLN